MARTKANTTRLSERESEALQDWIKGLTMKQVMRLRKISMSSAATYRYRVRHKLGIRTMLEAWYWWTDHCRRKA